MKVQAREIVRLAKKMSIKLVGILSWIFPAKTVQKNINPVFKVKNVSINYLYEPGQTVSFRYNRPNKGPTERVGEFERYSKEGKCILVHDYSVKGEPRWFDLSQVENPQILEANR